MTEADWLNDKNYIPHVVNWLYEQFGERKLRLFTAACCRRVWHLLGDEGSRRAVEFAEQMAERGKGGRRGRPAASADALAAAREAGKRRRETETGTDSVAYLEASARECAAGAALWVVANRANHAACHTAQSAAFAAAYAACQPTPAPTPFPPERHRLIDSEELWQRRLLRELYGNPFRPVAPDPAWLVRGDGAAAKVARAIYDERAFERAPILADALEDAGCADEAILSHLRGGGPHCRGCWAVDLVLGVA
jgi:hypothetical protein